MGKRKKSSKPQGPKKREPLAQQFQCLFCNHEKAVSVKIEKKQGVGHLSCKVCGQTFQTGTNCMSLQLRETCDAHQLTVHTADLSHAVDVYSDWIDACDAVAKEAADGVGKAAAAPYRDINPSSRPTAPVGSGDFYNKDDGFIDDDDVDAEADYADE
ncbi:hypothetical protein LTR50_004596 [Elasticomyces elasticus]|nr:hypothetical protein LTR50_004596 [Elasticomyces elasticus]